MELFTGRPLDQKKRLLKERKCYDFLEKIGINYFRVDHENADDMETCHNIEKVLGCPICKNLFLCNRQETEFYLLMMPGDKPFKTKVLSKQIGSARLSFASAEKMNELLDITPGSVSVLGLMNDTENRVNLLVDEDVLKEEYTGIHPCINTSTLKIKTEDIFSSVLSELKRTMKVIKLDYVEENI
jgi:Ala-tRNA(Pro) deacylase